MLHFRANTVKRLAKQHSNGHPISKDAITQMCSTADTILVDLLVACSRVAKQQKHKSVSPSTIGYVIRNDKSYKRLLSGFTMKSFKKTNHAARRKKLRPTTETSG